MQDEWVDIYKLREDSPLGKDDEKDSKSRISGVFIRSQGGQTNSKGERRHMTIVGISADVRKRLGWALYERVYCIVNAGKRLMLITRNPEAKWKVSPSKKRGLTDEQIDQQPCQISFQWDPGMPSVRTTKYCQYEIDERGLLIKVPPEASFEECIWEEGHNLRHKIPEQGEIPDLAE